MRWFVQRKYQWVFTKIEPNPAVKELGRLMGEQVKVWCDIPPVNFRFWKRRQAEKRDGK